MLSFAETSTRDADTLVAHGQDRDDLTLRLLSCKPALREEAAGGRSRDVDELLAERGVEVDQPVPRHRPVRPGR